MDLVAYNLKIVLILAVGFGCASLLGYAAYRARLSPVLGYLLAGYIIGPYSPGFVADKHIAEQLAEIGVVLMMFGVGMHFKWQELSNVKRIAIPGAIAQTLATCIASAALLHYFGWDWTAGLIVGMAIGVASTAVLVRVLADNSLLNKASGHIAVGWLIVEDIFTVAALILLPTIAAIANGEAVSLQSIGGAIVWMLIKFFILIAVMFTVGRKAVTFILFHIARTRSHELFTLTVLALIFAIATGSTLIFGASIALGAFIAGMVVGQTDVRQQASANSLPIQDAFVVLFFISIGMLFNPLAIVEHFALFLGILFIILVVKPIIAFIMVVAFKYRFRVALTVAFGLAQIGEFSFILAEQADHFNILPDEAYDIIIACALISISLNALLFKLIEPLNRWVEKKSPRFPPEDEKHASHLGPMSIVIGYGPIGQNVVQSLEKIGFNTIIVDQNVDTIAQLKEDNKASVFGDATQSEILEAAGIKRAKFLAITAPESNVVLNIIQAARALNPKIQIIARARYIEDRQPLIDLKVNSIYCEEEEAKKAFTSAVYKLTRPIYYLNARS
jgi:CPA2 family monovalent cation:H+ antiporter-2